MTDPRVSIVVPTYNMARFTSRCLRSAMAQDYPDLEIVVVDDASTEPTAEIVAELAAEDVRIRLSRNETNLGAPANFRRAIETSRGELVKFLNADDVLEPSCVSGLVTAMEDDSSVDVAFCLSDFVDEEGRRQELQIEPFGDRDLRIDGGELGREILTLGRTLGSPSCLLVRRRALAGAVAAGDEAKKVLEARGLTALPVDQFWYLSILREGGASFVGKTLVHVTAHGDSRSASLGHNPDWYAGHHFLVEWARSIGYLDDPRDEFRALLLFVGRTLEMSPNFDMTRRDPMLRMVGECHSAMVRMAEIEETLGAAALDTLVPPRFRGLWESRDAQRQAMAGMLATPRG